MGELGNQFDFIRFLKCFFFCIQSKMYKIFVSVNHHWKRCVAWGKWEMSGRKRGDTGIRPIDNSEWEWKLDSLVAHSWHFSYITYVYDNRSDMAMTLTWTEMSFDDRFNDISIADLGNSPAARCFSRAEQFWSSPRPRPSRWALRADADRNPSVQWHRVQRVNAAKENVEVKCGYDYYRLSIGCLRTCTCESCNRWKASLQSSLRWQRCDNCSSTSYSTCAEVDNTGASRSSRPTLATFVCTLTSAFSSLDSSNAFRKSISWSLDRLSDSLSVVISLESAEINAR